MEGLGIGVPNWITPNFMRHDSDGVLLEDYLPSMLVHELREPRGCIISSYHQTRSYTHAFYAQLIIMYDSEY